jgi:SNF2 family DNA or RNA helicase
MTISCASVGLDITAACRAYIMEPQWNPTVEEQALARVHRMGQTKEVTTVRYVMQGSFEERVVDTQHKKRELAELLLSPDGHTGLEKGIDKIKYFRSLLR